MVVTEDLLKDLKVLLFDLNASIGKMNQEKLMQQLVIQLQELLHADNISLVMQNNWNMNSQLDIYKSHAISYDIEQIAQKVMNDYNHYPTLRVIQTANGSYYTMKLFCNPHYYGVMLISCQDSQLTNDQLLETCSDLILKVLQTEYEHRVSCYLKERQTYFFDLTTSLHAVHETTAILKKVYTSFQKLFPFFDFMLLMSKDYECEEVPIELIEYSGDMAQSPGTLAFIDNTIKIDIQYDKDDMQLYAPLAGQQGVYGVIKIMMPQIVEESELELDLITQLSTMTGMALERSILFQSSNKQVLNLQMINDASQALNLKLERTDIIDTVKKYVSETSEADDFAIVLFDEEANGVTTAPYEILEESTDYFTSNGGKKLIHYLYHHLIAKGEAILSGNFQTRYRESQYHSLIAIPMWSAKVIFGFIVVAHPIPYYFTFDRYKFIQSFIQHASLAFKNSMLQAQLHQLATTDYLTKLHSRNYLDKLVTEHMEHGAKGTFALFDVDDFKQVNDTFGHYTGDKVLKQIAKLISEHTKSTRVITARWGGEEFALYFPDYSIDDVIKKTNELSEDVFKTTAPQVTLSCGIAEWQAGSTCSDIKHLFVAADEALYEAKLSGKDRTVQKVLNE